MDIKLNPTRDTRSPKSTCPTKQTNKVSMKLYKCDQLIYGARVWKLSLIFSKMPLNYIIINYYCLENVNEFSLTAILQFITELIWIILNIQRPLATFLANVVNSWVSPFWILSYFLLLYILLRSLLLYYSTTTIVNIEC